MLFVGIFLISVFLMDFLFYCLYLGVRYGENILMFLEWIKDGCFLVVIWLKESWVLGISVLGWEFLFMF